MTDADEEEEPHTGKLPGYYDQSKDFDASLHTISNLWLSQILDRKPKTSRLGRVLF